MCSELVKDRCESPRKLTRSYRRNVIWVLSIVNNIFVEADPRLQLVLQQVDFVEETGHTAETIGKKNGPPLNANVLLTG